MAQISQPGVLDNNTDELSDDSGAQNGLKQNGRMSNGAKKGALGQNGTNPALGSTVDLSDAKLVPSLIIVRTTYFYQNHRLEKQTEEVIARFYTTKVKPKLLDRVGAQMEAAKQSGFDGTYDILSRRGRRLASVTKAGARDKNTLTIVSEETPTRGLIRKIAASGATQIMVQTPEQLKKILPVARRMGIEKIYAPEKMLEGIKLGKQGKLEASLITPMPEVQIKSSQSNILVPKAEKNDAPLAKTTPNTKILHSQFEDVWHGVALPSRVPALAVGVEIATPQREKKRTQNEPILVVPEQVRDQILLERIMTSITADLEAAIELGKTPREDLVNLDRASKYIRAKTTPETAIETMASVTQALPAEAARPAIALPREATRQEKPIAIDAKEERPVVSKTAPKADKEARALSAIERLRTSRRGTGIGRATAKTLAA